MTVRLQLSDAVRGIMMNDGVSRRLITLTVAGLLIVGVLACSIGGVGQPKPTVVITYPQPGVVFSPGQEVVVQSVSATNDVKGINRVELWVDGTLVHSQAIDPPVTSYTASQPWVPGVVGTHIVEVRAYDVDSRVSDPARVTVSVGEIPGPGTPGATGGATPTSPGGGPAATDQVSSGAMVTASVGLNVRSGPGIDYEAVGGLRAGESAQIAGKNADGSWWQIVYPAGSGGRAWVSANAKYSTAVRTEGVPVVETPPLPATAFPTSTPTSPLPTETAGPPPPPPSSKPVIYSFTADRYTITAGESVTLYWDLANAEAAYLHYDGNVQGVVAPGNKTLAPAVTTTYKLVAHNAQGDTTAQLTITVNPPSGPTTILDFVSGAPSAAWTSNWGANVLPWNGSDTDSRGFVKWRDNAFLEDGSRPARVLETHPQWVPNGHIAGEYALPRPIQTGDRFRATVGFLQGAGGDVTFSVLAAGGSVTVPTVVASVADSGTDGTLRNIDVGLDPFAGATHIILVVEAGPSSGQDWAVWRDARLID